MSGAPSDAPVPTNHMSDPECVQLTRPMPAEFTCSASNPSAIWPVAATAAPPAPLAPASPGTLTVVTVPGTDTVTGCAAVAPSAADAPAAATGIALSSAEPAAAAFPPAADPVCDDIAIMATCAEPVPGGAGGHDLVTDVTAMVRPAACAAGPLAAGCVRHAITATTAIASSTPQKRARRRFTTRCPCPSGRRRRASG